MKLALFLTPEDYAKARADIIRRRPIRSEPPPPEPKPAYSLNDAEYAAAMSRIRHGRPPIHTPKGTTP